MSRVGVLISGRGTNLQALIDAEKNGELAGTVVLVISNKSEAQGLLRAQSAGIDMRTVTKTDFPIREEHDKQVVQILQEFDVDLVVLAGYMRILTDTFLSEFENRIINVHPSILPSFKGVKAQWQAVEHGVRYAGCTTHFVNADMDDGPIILQAIVKVEQNDTGEGLADRILIEEHRILVESVNLFCEGRLSIDGRKVIIREG
ncbi:MAG: phosphoribosylglycinamide formyltransferase [Candidatus Thorarchaeota archaeon]|jgi:phosphoribosylglycinamide formyltransferase-1